MTSKRVSCLSRRAQKLIRVVIRNRDKGTAPVLSMSIRHGKEKNGDMSDETDGNLSTSCRMERVT